ncbi:hypothetical protein ACFQNF_04925 [Iodobacter arcticus]|uniref:Calpain catalytic domain-containing protein n=1 Tax=Iodobacter arcticus TaxID=590593 RepID=A0ABW2QVX3_9NEIS
MTTPNNADLECKQTDSLGAANGKDNIKPICMPKKIQFLTELDKGSGNDGTGNSISKAMLYDHRYNIEVCLFNGEKLPNSEDYKWAIEYVSPSTPGKAIRRDLKQQGARIGLEIDDIDYCGCELSIQAYTDSPEKFIELKQLVHHRFYWVDKKRIDKQIQERKSEPWRIDQGSSSLCGMAALYYVTIKNSADRYQKIAQDLHRMGECTIDGFRIKPSAKMYEIDLANHDGYKRMRMWEVDWIVLAGTRSSESNLGYHGLESGSWDQYAAINWPGMMEELVKKIGGYKQTKAVDVGLATPLIQNAFLSNSRDPTKDLPKLDEMDKSYREGKQVLMMIDASMLSDRSGYKLSDIAQSHWIVYEGGMAKDSINQRVKFKVFSWGWDPSTGISYDIKNGEARSKERNPIKTSDSILFSSFTSNHYGHIEAYN